MIDLRFTIDARGLPARFSIHTGAGAVKRGATFAVFVVAGTRHAMTINAESSEEAMGNLYTDSEAVRTDNQAIGNQERTRERLPNRLLTAFEVASFIGCHEETVRRAYWRGLLRSQRFGVRGRRFHPEDVLDWLRRGAPTRVS